MDERDRSNPLFEYAPVALLRFDEHARLVEVNHSATALLRAEREWCCARTLESLAAEEHRSAVSAHLRRVAANPTRQSVEVPVVDRLGNRIWVRLESRALPDNTGVAALVEISDRKQIEDDLLLAREDAQRSDRAKSDFMANVSHEIRTPLSGILSVAELALGGEMEPRVRDYLEAIHSSARSLVAIADDLLDISLVESERVPVRSERFEPVSLLQTLEAIFQPNAARKGLELRFEGYDTLSPVLVGDKNRIRQVLVNLISNAIEYTAEGHVHVTVREDAVSDFVRELTVAITDTGEGIPREFRASYTVDEGTARGLSIARRLAKLMGGQVYFDTSRVGGTRVFFAVPLQRAEEGSVSTVARGGADGAMRGKVLVAEDNSINELVLRTILEQRGCEVTSVTNGASALEAVQRTHFDLVVMDISMPGLDGVTVTKRIRHGEVAGVAADLPIVAISAHSMRGDREQFLAAGFDEYIAKPFSQQEIISTARRYMGARNVARATEQKEER